jgi:hypothetical protein
LGRVDLKRLRRELGQESSAHAPAGSLSWMALGGLAKLIGSLEENFDFAAPQASQLAGVDMMALTGRWKPERLAELSLDREGRGLKPQTTIDPGNLPPHVPHRANVWLGQDDLFPYRVEYLRQEAESSGNRHGQADGGHWTVVTCLDFYDVSVPATIDPLQFVYKPDATEIEDRTRAMVETLTASAVRGE